MFPDFYLRNFFLENSITDNIPQQSFTNRSKLLIPINKIPQKEWKILNKDKKCPNSEPKHFAKEIKIILNIDNRISLN